MAQPNINLPEISPIPIKDRLSVLFIERCRIDVVDGAFVSIADDDTHTHIPIGGVACVMLEPGTRISHRAVQLCAIVGTLITWVGEGAVRLYSAGQPGGARSDKLLYQAKLALDDELRLKVVRKMFELRFHEKPPERRSVQQLQGIEGARVRAMYKNLAQQYGVPWKGRKYDVNDWEAGDTINKCLNSATSCLYGVTEAAILAAGYAPSIGFIHTGKSRSFVFDIADIIKFETVVPVAFRMAKKHPHANAEREVRRACRDMFRESHVLKRLIPLIEEVLAAGEIALPEASPDQVLPAFDDSKGIGDEGHRT
jgi:CRISPR-associated protein Cas1